MTAFVIIQELSCLIKSEQKEKGNIYIHLLKARIAVVG